MKIEIKKNDVYIPDWNGNIELPETDQIRINYRYLTVDERKKYIGIEPAKLTQNAKTTDDQAITMQYKQDTRGILLASITKIEGLETSEGEITTARQLLDTPDCNGLGSLVATVEAYLLNVNTASDKKK